MDCQMTTFQVRSGNDGTPKSVMGTDSCRAPNSDSSIRPYSTGCHGDRLVLREEGIPNGVVAKGCISTGILD